MPDPLIPSIAEIGQPWTGDTSMVEVKYQIKGAVGDLAARETLEALSPAMHGTMVRTQEGNYHVEPILGHEAAGWWIGTVKYVSQAYTPSTTDDTSFSFDTKGGSAHLTQSLETVGRYAVSGTPGDYKGAIGVTSNSVDGVDIQVPQFAFTVKRFISAAAMASNGYMQKLYLATGKVNSSPVSMNVDGVVLDFDTGELRFDGGTGSKRKSVGDWEINMAFSASANVPGLTIGGITGINKGGWEYLWARYRDVSDAVNKCVLKQASEAYVEIVYYDYDLNQLPF